MADPLRLRALTEEERVHIARMSQSHTALVRAVARARMIQLASEGGSVSVIAARLHVAKKVVRCWLTRFNADGLNGVQDKLHSGRPATYSREEVGGRGDGAHRSAGGRQVFGAWTFERLEGYLNDEKGIAIKHSRIQEILHAEGLRWRQQETWFGARVDPDFAQKRGPLRLSIRSRQRAVS